MGHSSVVHCREYWDYDVYIGRGKDPVTGESPKRDWGNPFRIGRDGSRKKVCELHKQHILTRPHLVDMARLELKGQTLGCWCAPKECHGDFLATLAETVPVCHVDDPCSCFEDRECNHCKGIYHCQHCGGAEGSLASECPRVRVTSDQDEGIYSGNINYIAGEWVDGCYDTSGKLNMPFWAGIVHVVERNPAPPPTEVNLKSLLITDE